ncbi:flavonol synthase/flavanone 3-hydroxylase [Lentinula novae-zelandiae]|nr:flavonol synthase/flavanone 3-hydroxylase [Lentinula novae-zelandiae]
MAFNRESLPTVNFVDFGDGTSKLFEACRDVGFAYLVNTGIPQGQIDGMFDWAFSWHHKSAKLFALPIETKLKAPHPQEGWKHRGYSGVCAHKFFLFQDAQLNNFKESFDLGSEDSQTLPNNWIPDEDLPGFQTYATNFYNTCREFQLSILLPALALGLDLPKDFFLGYHEANENQLRLLHYPGAPTSVFESGERGRIGAHTDFGTGTLLFQDDCGGLQVETPSQPGVFMHVPPVPGTVLFNIGDFLMRWSNDTLKSTLHRVRAPPRRDGQGDDGETKERFSIAYFMGADKEKTIECLPGCSGPDKSKNMSLSRNI